MFETDIIVNQMPAFKRAYKRIHGKQKLQINLAIQRIIENPEIGEVKRGELAGVYVYKFKIDLQEMLLAYEWDSKQRLLLTLGVHENFYHDLKKRL